MIALVQFNIDHVIDDVTDGWIRSTALKLHVCAMMTKMMTRANAGLVRLNGFT